MSIASASPGSSMDRVRLDVNGRAPLVRGGFPLLGHGARLGKDPLAFLRECQAEYGDVFTIKVPGGRRTFIMHPHDHPAYFRNHSMRFLEPGAEMGGRVFGYGWEDVEKSGPELFAQRTSTMMKGDPLQKMSERMQFKLEERLFALPVGEWLEGGLLDWANEMIFAAGTDAIFGDGFYGPRLKEAFTKLDDNFGYLVMGVPTWLLPGCRKAQRDLADAMLRFGPHHAEIIDDRFEHYDEFDLPRSLTTHYDSGLMWAAQANTVPAAFWTLFYLLRDERAFAEVLEEVRGVAGELGGGAPGERLFSRNDLKAMVKLDSAVSEMNRLTTAPMVPRRALEDTELELHDGVVLKIDEGQDLALFPPVTQMDPEIYPDPEAFVFDRFIDAEGRKQQFFKDGKRVAFNMLPFGGGVSMCPGRYFAINEFKIAVATLMLWFDIELLEDAQPDFNYARTGFGTYPPVSDVRFRYRRRAS